MTWQSMALQLRYPPCDMCGFHGTPCMPYPCWECTGGSECTGSCDRGEGGAVGAVAILHMCHMCNMTQRFAYTLTTADGIVLHVLIDE